jgi:signal transduction histidine kinase
MKLTGEAFDLTLLSNFLHQIINPLNGVCGTLDNITEKQVPEGSVPQRLRAARAQLEHCVSLLRNLAFFSEFTSDPQGYRERHKGKISVIPKVILEAAMFFQETARKKKMQIHLVDSNTQFKVQADPDLLRQVFMNLFDNCVKYGEANTDILIKPRIQRKSNDLIIEVVGTSTPPPLELREKIFELGVRGENARQIVASGTGLGLYICRAITNVYEGSVEYKTRPAANESTFTIRLPGGYL